MDSLAAIQLKQRASIEFELRNTIGSAGRKHLTCVELVISGWAKLSGESR